MIPATALLVAVVSSPNADRAQFPVSVHPFIYYLRVDNEIDRAVLPFVVSACSRATVLENHLPVRIDESHYRIRLDHLGWEKAFPRLVREHYPYSRLKLPMVIRADWFIASVMDQRKTGSIYHELIFGRALKDTADFKAQLAAVENSPQSFGMIEDSSRVAQLKTRVIRSIPTLQRFDLFKTEDYKKLDAATDPLQQLPTATAANPHYAVSEWIGSLPKLDRTTGLRGFLPVYLLSDAAGSIQFEAPIDIVADSTQIRGGAIVNPISCVACHTEGLRYPSVNAISRFLDNDALLAAQLPDRDAIEAFHLSDFGSHLKQHNIVHEATLRRINGLTTAANAAAFQQSIQQYDRAVTPDQAARELGITPAELYSRLTTASVGGQLPARLVGLARGIPISRDLFEQLFPSLLEIVK